jgi:transcriptional regulator with XRE-family HTH domain
MPSPDDQLSELLRRFRRRAMLTQEDLAARTGLTDRTIRRIETDQLRRPRLKTLRSLAYHLGLSDSETALLLASGGCHDSLDPEPSVAAPVSPRDDLPGDVCDFTGRNALTAQVMDVLLNADSLIDRAHPRTGAVLVGLSGPAGVGKTALAVHIGHLVDDQYPDGRLYLDMHGLDDRPLTFHDAVQRMLRWRLGPDAAVPETFDECAALLRVALSGRRTLIILDNLRSEAQVRPILPTACGNAALLISRSRLAALDNLRRFDLDVLASDEALDMLSAIVGPARVLEDRSAAETVIQLCGSLPLALRIVGARLAAYPHWTLRRMARQLTDEDRRLDALAIGDRAVRLSIKLSYRTLGPAQRMLFRLLGALTETDVPAWVAAALLDCADAEAETVAEALVEARLLDAHRVPGDDSPRYGMHGLVRLYARELCLAADTEQDRAAAAQRMVGSWLRRAERGEPGLPGGVLRLGALPSEEVAVVDPS